MRSQRSEVTARTRQRRQSTEMRRGSFETFKHTVSSVTAPTEHVSTRAHLMAAHPASAMLFVLLSSLYAGAEAMAALAPGDTVTVIGASGNVGKLVALRLADTFNVRGVVRDSSKARAFLGDKVTLFEADLRGDDVTGALAPALNGAQAMVVCTGTTAFPTKAWSPNGREGVALPVLKALYDARESEGGFGEVVKSAIGDLSAQSFNTPSVVDEQANLKLIKAWEAAAGEERKRLVLLSSVGVQRRAEMPYPILNACGVLDAKAAAEAAIQADAASGGYAYTFVRPGQLFGGPYDNNYYLGTLFQLDKDADTREVLIGKGDVTMNDDPQLGTLRSTLAEVIAQALESDAALNADFTVVNAKGEFPQTEVLRERLAAL